MTAGPICCALSTAASQTGGLRTEIKDDPAGPGRGVGEKGRYSSRSEAERRRMPGITPNSQILPAHVSNRVYFDFGAALPRVQ
jgi:hypothetical protein